MMAFLQETEASLQGREMLGVRTLETNPAVYPPLEYHSARGLAPHFVLKNETGKTRRSQCVELEKGAESRKEVDAAAELILSRSRLGMTGDMDFAEAVPSEENWG